MHQFSDITRSFPESTVKNRKDYASVYNLQTEEFITSQEICTVSDVFCFKPTRLAILPNHQYFIPKWYERCHF